jgi:sphinganine-1-phosphate aldolase
VYKLPDKPWKEETILNRMTTGADAAKQYYTNGGRISGAVYMAQDSHWDFIGQVMRLNIESNPLHMVQFSNISQLEAEIIRVTLDLFHGDEESCGLTTSGGTESILLAMLAYREWGRARGITKPNVVASITAHAAFDKACFYFGIELRKV